MKKCCDVALEEGEACETCGRCENCCRCDDALYDADELGLDPEEDDGR